MVRSTKGGGKGEGETITHHNLPSKGKEGAKPDTGKRKKTITGEQSAKSISNHTGL